jgi:hypothetical protein
VAVGVAEAKRRVRVTVLHSEEKEVRVPVPEVAVIKVNLMEKAAVIVQLVGLKKAKMLHLSL